MELKRVTIKQYGLYYATIPHKGGGRPKQGTARAIYNLIAQGKPLPGVEEQVRYGKWYELHVSDTIYKQIKKLEKLNLAV